MKQHLQNAWHGQGLSLNKGGLLSGGSDGKASVYNAGDLGSFPGLGISPREGNGKPLQYSCLRSPMNRGVWQATVHGVTKRCDLAAEQNNSPIQMISSSSTESLLIRRVHTHSVNIHSLHK